MKTNPDGTRKSVCTFRKMCSTVEGREKCLEAQVEEIEVLCSIYGDEWKTENEVDRSYSIEVKQDDLCVTLYVTLPETYPYESPPTYTLLAPCLNKEQKSRLTNDLEEIYLQNIGQTVLFQWIDKLKEYLSTLNPEIIVENSPDSKLAIEKEEKHEFKNFTPEIIHGAVINDRKSTFQGHVAIVLSVNEVSIVLDELKQNRKIANATHNIYAYRIFHSENSFIQDCDDDGETNAGKRLLHLLQILDTRNVLVVVSRWYGGIHLGPDRFSHINNAARQALEQAGLINVKKKA